jgi:hypothetical protein
MKLNLPGTGVERTLDPAKPIVAEVGASASGLRRTADELRTLLKHLEGALCSA